MKGQILNEVEQEAIIDETLFSPIFGWYRFFFFQTENLPCTNRSVFFECSLRLRSSRTLLTGGPAADGYAGLDLRIAAGGAWTCQHKVNGSDSLTAHQSLEMFLKCFLRPVFLDPIWRHKSEIITAKSQGFCDGASSAPAKRRSRLATSLTDGTEQTNVAVVPHLMGGGATRDGWAATNS